MFSSIIKNDFNNIENGVNPQEKYLSKFPKRTEESIKTELEKVTGLLMQDQESNRYSEILRKKFSNDKNIKKFKNFENSNVDSVEFNDENNKMKANVLFQNLNEKYNLTLDINVVSQGRIFVRDFKAKKIK